MTTHQCGAWENMGDDMGFMGSYGILWDLMGKSHRKMVVLWDFMGFYGILWDFMGFYGIYLLVMTNIEIQNGHVYRDYSLFRLGHFQ